MFNTTVGYLLISLAPKPSKIKLKLEGRSKPLAVSAWTAPGQRKNSRPLDQSCDIWLYFAPCPKSSDGKASIFVAISRAYQCVNVRFPWHVPVPRDPEYEQTDESSYSIRGSLSQSDPFPGINWPVPIAGCDSLGSHPTRSPSCTDRSWWSGRWKHSRPSSTSLARGKLRQRLSYSC